MKSCPEKKKKEKLNNKKIKDLKKGFSPKRWKDQIQQYENYKVFHWIKEDLKKRGVFR